MLLLSGTYILLQRCLRACSYGLVYDIPYCRLFEMHACGLVWARNPFPGCSGALHLVEIGYTSPRHEINDLTGNILNFVSCGTPYYSSWPINSPNSCSKSMSHGP
ncbi:hypothetical protein BABINDRAFT_109739 [Babjeviella inositovora NRRL Y-12698]|uniref:Uncharacterized protein n=1 Tax=Babjeviella inositovora NRRL Y-12698 TaxID=984486 RepID=A0A1E3QVF8_9ASCO|nr:uncharacterized protein BABINDRAFT_109739 [Babjeviella inositovora NRRL Y-12698]ODQ81640.1 hypothetical protein BABINDRAFT_109739 [Babjeviella inositovora NRRL Y-12698]